MAKSKAHGRKRFNTSKFRRIRQRILVANSNVTEPMKLCNRTRSALDYLLKCKNLTTVRESFLHLGNFYLSYQCDSCTKQDNIKFSLIRLELTGEWEALHMYSLSHNDVKCGEIGVKTSIY